MASFFQMNSDYQNQKASKQRETDLIQNISLHISVWKENKTVTQREFIFSFHLPKTAKSAHAARSLEINQY